jgi:hypothetical protein
MENLKALHTALMLYQESEGQFPDASGWMEAIKMRTQTSDMKEEESIKKFINPLIRPAGAAIFGYAMNDACSKKYNRDIPEPAKTPLIFDSQDTAWNAHGDPAKLLPNPPRQGGNFGISVEGSVLKL